MSSPEATVVLCTVPSMEVGRELATLLIEKELAACVNIVPGLESHYLWEGKVECEKEELLIIKSRKSLFESLKDALISAHPYECPEVLSLPVAAGSEGYLRWIQDNTRTQSL